MARSWPDHRRSHPPIPTHPCLQRPQPQQFRVEYTDCDYPRPKLGWACPGRGALRMRAPRWPGGRPRMQSALACNLLSMRRRTAGVHAAAAVVVGRGQGLPQGGCSRAIRERLGFPKARPRIAAARAAAPPKTAPAAAGRGRGAARCVLRVLRALCDKRPEGAGAGAASGRAVQGVLESGARAGAMALAPASCEGPRNEKSAPARCARGAQSAARGGPPLGRRQVRPGGAGAPAETRTPRCNHSVARAARGGARPGTGRSAVR